METISLLDSYTLSMHNFWYADGRRQQQHSPVVSCYLAAELLGPFNLSTDLGWPELVVNLFSCFYLFGLSDFRISVYMTKYHEKKQSIPKTSHS